MSTDERIDPSTVNSLFVLHRLRRGAAGRVLLQGPWNLLIPIFLQTSSTLEPSASFNAATICSSVNLLLRIFSSYRFRWRSHVFAGSRFGVQVTTSTQSDPSNADE